MADVRALLKAKRQEARVNHPLASYSDKTGQLKCSICHKIIKHASAWDGHIGSKNHRTNVARLKEQERLRGEKEQGEKARGKRKTEEDRPSVDSGLTKKRKISDEEDDEEDAADDSPAPDQSDIKFPGDFFSDASRAPLSPASDESDDEPEALQPVAQAATALDMEWERFQRTVVNPPDITEAYDRATIFAEPELAPETPEGFPLNQPDGSPVEVPNKMDEEQARRQKEQDERELIMGRLLDEEAAQEEADMKVTKMKERMEALKKKREVAKALKAAK